MKITRQFRLFMLGFLVLVAIVFTSRVDAAPAPGQWELNIANVATTLLTCSTRNGLVRNCHGVVNDFYGARFPTNAPYHFAGCGGNGESPGASIGATITCNLYDKTGTQLSGNDATLSFVVTGLPPELAMNELDLLGAVLMALNVCVFALGFIGGQQR